MLLLSQLLRGQWRGLKPKKKDDCGSLLLLSKDPLQQRRLDVRKDYITA
jgi:hypothetical protein